MHRRVVLLMATALIAGCGGGMTEEEQAQEDWHTHVGSAWEEFESGYEDGWTEACVAVSSKLRREEPDWMEGHGCGTAGTPSDSIEVPVTPPGDPRAEGYELGLYEGCYDAFIRVGRDPGCPVEPEP